MSRILGVIIAIPILGIFGFAMGICFLYFSQDFYPDSIKIVFITIFFALWWAASRAPTSIVADFVVSVILFTVLPSNASIIENPFFPVVETSQAIALINGGWGTLNELMLDLNPQYACEATKGAVAWDIARTSNFNDGIGEIPEDYFVTDVLPDDANESWVSKPNAVCMVELRVNGIPVRVFKVVTSSGGYEWSEAHS